MHTILITGCSSGIGYHAAKALHELGYRVYASARKEEDVERLRAEGLRCLQLDVSDSDSINDAVNELMLLTGNELYAVFHNAGYGQAGAVEDLPRTVLEQQFATNFFGWHELTCRLLPLMRNQGYGRIIYNSSLLGYVTLPFRGAYNASKFAVEGLAATLRQELHGTDIHVVLIQPGPISSRFRQNSHAVLKQTIDMENSVHHEKYRRAIRRLEKEGPVAPFTLGPEAVLKKLIHALENEKPKAMYPVTFPAYLFAYMKRFLSTRVLDKVMLKVSGGEHKN